MRSPCDLQLSGLFLQKILFPFSCSNTETSLKKNPIGFRNAARVGVFYFIILKHIVKMNADIILVSILLVGLVLLNKEYIRSEFLTKKEDE